MPRLTPSRRTLSLMPRRRPDPHTLLGAYAMDAVSDGDRASFERHLGGCESCRAELRGLREATVRLAAAAEVRPPPELREQTVHAALRVPQLPPAPRPSHPAWPARSQHSRGRSAPARARRPWALRLAAAALGFAVAAGLGYAVHDADHQAGMAQRRSHAIAAVLGAPDAVMLTAKVSTGGRATVVMSHRDRALVFTAARLAPLSGARSYQLWLMGPSGDRPAGLLPAPRDGMTGPMVISGLGPGDMVGLTVEPAGGAPAPTTAPILMLALSPAGAGKPSG